MKRQLEQELRRACERAGTEAATERFDQLAASIEKEYDKRVAGGMSELDAYREMLRDIHAIEELLRETSSNGRAEEESTRGKNRSLEQADLAADGAREREERARWNRKMKVIEGAVQSIWWLLAVFFYFFISICFGHWHMTWVGFLWAAIGTLLIDMLFQYNRGRPLGRMFGHLSAMMWLALAIVYFVAGFLFRLWSLAWLVFLLGAIVQILLSTARRLGK